MVIVAAVLTASHDGRPSCRSVASCSIFWNKDCIFGGAGTGPGRECAAFMSCLRAGESLDMVGDRIEDCEVERNSVHTETVDGKVAQITLIDLDSGNCYVENPSQRAHIN